MPNNIDEELKLTALFERTNLQSVTEFEKVLAKSLDKILGKLASFPTEFSRTRYRAMLKDIKELIEADYPKLEALIKEDQKVWAAMSYEASQAALVTAIPATAVVAQSFAALPTAAVNRILDPQMLIQGATLSQQVSKMSINNSHKMTSIIADGVTTGRPTADINREIREIYGDIARNKVDALSRTAIATATDEANTEAIRQIDKVSNVVDTAYYSAVIDSRTTPICSFS